MITSFVERGRNRVEALRTAAASDDHEAMVGIAHELRGAAGTIGAIRVAAVCRTVETEARHGRALDRTVLDDLVRELDRANTALQRVDVQLT